MKSTIDNRLDRRTARIVFIVETGVAIGRVHGMAVQPGAAQSTVLSIPCRDHGSGVPERQSFGKPTAQRSNTHLPSRRFEDARTALTAFSIPTPVAQFSRRGIGACRRSPSPGRCRATVSKMAPGVPTTVPKVNCCNKVVGAVTLPDQREASVTPAASSTAVHVAVRFDTQDKIMPGVVGCGREVEARCDRDSRTGARVPREPLAALSSRPSSSAAPATSAGVLDKLSAQRTARRPVGSTVHRLEYRVPPASVNGRRCRPGRCRMHAGDRNNDGRSLCRDQRPRLVAAPIGATKP